MAPKRGNCLIILRQQLPENEGQVFEHVSEMSCTNKCDRRPKVLSVLSERAVEELHQWLLQGDQPANPPPPYNRENGRQSFPSSAPSGVEAILGSSRGIPRHIRENIECEQNFERLPFAAIEPFPAEEQEWDADEPDPRPLQNGLEWPRGRGRRTRFNPRSVEQERHRLSAPVPVGELPMVPLSAEIARPVPGPGRVPHPGSSIRGSPPMPRDGRDPPRGACFNCRQGGHTRLNCRELPACFAITAAAGEPR